MLCYVLITVEEHYGCSPTGFEHTIPALGGAGSLLDVLNIEVARRWPSCAWYLGLGMGWAWPGSFSAWGVEVKRTSFLLGPVFS